tara:strand:- start:984 stop:1235 length:252 start_codon:yes stop_codon:yes gene_type:complete
MSEIIKGVAIPERPTGRPKKYNYANLDKMAVEDMWKIDLPPQDVISQEAKIIRNHVGRYKKKNPNREYTVRSLEDGIGVWRIK